LLLLATLIIMFYITFTFTLHQSLTPHSQMGLYAMVLFSCLSVRPFVCLLWNLLSYSLRGSTCLRAAVYHIESGPIYLF